jgi:C_GCAxxG_C_C family probable redox protein
LHDERFGFLNVKEGNRKLSEQKRVKELQEKAVRYFCDRPSNFPTGRPYNCCESVLLALKDYLGAGSELIPRIGTGIGAGVSLNGLLCGSVSSVAIAIGMKYGRTSPEENPRPIWDMVNKYVAEFKDRFGYVNCRQLTGLDLKTKEGLKEYFAKVHDYACVARIRFAVKKAIEILKE